MVNKNFEMVFAFLLVLMVGCNKSSPPDASSNSGNQITGPALIGSPNYNNPSVIPYPSVDPNANDNLEPTTGHTVPLSVVSTKVLTEYVDTHPLNAPSNIKLNVDLVALPDGRFGGTVHIMYKDAGLFYDGVFNSGIDRNPSIESLKDNNELEAKYNYWFKFKNKVYYSGFFQDEFGAIVLVIDNVKGSADAEGNTKLSGSVWYKNFAKSKIPQSPYRKCWFLRAGIYDCRSTTVMDKSYPYPSGGYTQLGAFSGLIRAKAFHK